MRLINSKWVDLATGYRIMLSLQTRLENEFGKSVQVSLQHQYDRDLTNWVKKRRIFLALAVLAPLSIIGLCVAAYYYREAACVIIYWVMLVVVLLVTLGIAGRNYIRDILNKPAMVASPAYVAGLEERFWASLAPPPVNAKEHKGEADFLGALATLPDDYVGLEEAATGNIPPVYLFAPSGPWLFTVRDWGGEIIKQDGVWKQIRKRGEPMVYVDAPDDEWFALKEKLAIVLSEHFPQTAGQIRGGVVFINPVAQLSKTLIQGNIAPVGSADAWLERLRAEPPIQGLTLDMQLKTLDALLVDQRVGMEPVTAASARELAMRLYEEIAGEMRLFISKRLKSLPE